ncbi:hypothetical protein V8B55DRAFT_1417919 [Mucor lusitanicus]
MEEEYDCSMYRTVCTISICPVSNDLQIHRISNRISEASSRYLPFNYLQAPLGFYYNKESGNVLYGNLMIDHYKQHPPHEKYIYVSNFVEDLYTLYQRSCKGEPENQHEKALQAAITVFLTRIYPMELSDKEEASTTQYVFVLPSHKYTNKTFIEEYFRPLLRATPWLMPGDLSSKIVFSKSIDALGYLLDGSLLPWCKLKLQREKKYLFCNLKKMVGQDKVLLSANFIRAVYDPDLIAASRRSMTTLGGETLLWPKLVAPPLTVEIPVSPAIEGINNLVSFLNMKVFADGGNGLNRQELDDYNTDSEHQSLMHYLIRSIPTSSFRNEWNRNIETNHFPDAIQWCSMLSDENKKRLSQITYMDTLQFFNNFNTLPLESKIVQYLQQHNDEENFQSVVIFNMPETTRKTYQNRLHHKAINFEFANKHGSQFYLLKIQHSVSSIIKGFRRNSYATAMSLDEFELMDGYALKALKMVQVSNKLGRPVVIKPSGNPKKESRKAPAIQKEKVAIIDKIQPYGYYVEANISCSNKIELSLNQVIETATDNGILQRSTLSIDNSSYQASDMYDSIFDAVWNIIDGHMANPLCKSLQEDDPTPLDGYKVIRADLIDAIKNSMESKSNVPQDLEEAVYHYNAKPNCTCNLMITHRLVINTGLLPYLSYIACNMVASLKSNAIFGNYRISLLYMTGGFLYKWLEQGNSTYGKLIWKQLQDAISTELYKKQLRIHLMMVKSMVLEDKILNYKPFKLEKYRQVLSKQFYLRISPNRIKTFQVYQDKGDHSVKIPVTRRQEDDLIWEIPLVIAEGKSDLKHSLAEKFYVLFNADDAHELYCEIA